MKVTMVTVVTDALGKVPKCQEIKQGELDIRERIETIQTTVVLKSAKILRRVLETWGDILSLTLKKTTQKTILQL